MDLTSGKRKWTPEKRKSTSRYGQMELMASRSWKKTPLLTRNGFWESGKISHKDWENQKLKISPLGHFGRSGKHESRDIELLYRLINSDLPQYLPFLRYISANFFSEIIVQTFGKIGSTPWENPNQVRQMSTFLFLFIKYSSPAE